MTQPYFHDTSSRQYDESPLFQYTENFQPFDTGYNEYHIIDGYVWPASHRAIDSTIPAFYNEAPLPSERAQLQPARSHASIPQQELSPVSTAPYNPTYGYPMSFEAPGIPPQYFQHELQQIQFAEFSPVSELTPALTALPKRPVIALEWRNNDMNTPVKERPKPTKKRKTSSIAPMPNQGARDIKDSTLPIEREAVTARSLEDCMGLFDTTLTATKEKRRRKALTAQEKKVVKSVRTVGACIQCRFRKKTCSAGNPCPYCARLYNSTPLGNQLCQRESPFIERSMAQYYRSSSRKRILDFRLSTTELEGSPGIAEIGRTGPVSLPLRIKVLKCKTESLGSVDRDSVLHTVKTGTKILRDSLTTSETIDFIQPGSLSAAELEQWAFNYTHRFAKTKNPRANGFLFSVEYAKRGLPYSDLVNKITRLVSLNFVLRANATSITDTPSPFRTVQAQVDTLLFESFKVTEKSLFHDLQRLIFRSAGSLARDAVLPVCFCVWQLARLQCMLASQLTNLTAYDLKRSRRSPVPAPFSPPSGTTKLTTRNTGLGLADPESTHRARQTEAENQTHGLNLILCTFEALFRNACPLLLDWTDTFSKELLDNDDELIGLASKMGRTLRLYRAKGHSRRFKLGIGYNAEMSGQIRELLRDR